MGAEQYLKVGLLLLLIICYSGAKIIDEQDMPHPVLSDSKKLAQSEFNNLIEQYIDYFNI